MPTNQDAFVGRVYRWKEPLFHDAHWQSYRLRLRLDGVLVWDDPQTASVKGTVRLESAFRRISIATLYCGEQSRSASERLGTPLEDYGLLIPFGNVDRLHLTQLAVDSAADVRNWIEAMALSLNVGPLLADLLRDRRHRILSRQELVQCETFWNGGDQPPGHRSRSSTTVFGDDRRRSQSSLTRLLATFDAEQCAEVWNQLQQVYDKNDDSDRPDIDRRSIDLCRRVSSDELTVVDRLEGQPRYCRSRSLLDF